MPPHRFHDCFRQILQLVGGTSTFWLLPCCCSLSHSSLQKTFKTKQQFGQNLFRFRVLPNQIINSSFETLLERSRSSRTSKWIRVIFTTVCCSKSSYLCDKRLTRFLSPSGLDSDRNPFNESPEFCSLVRPDCKAELGLEVMQYNLVNFALEFT